MIRVKSDKEAMTAAATCPCSSGRSIPLIQLFNHDVPLRSRRNAHANTLFYDVELSTPEARKFILVRIPDPVQDIASASESKYLIYTCLMSSRIYASCVCNTCSVDGLSVFITWIGLPTNHG